MITLDSSNQDKIIDSIYTGLHYSSCPENLTFEKDLNFERGCNEKWKQTTFKYPSHILIWFYKTYFSNNRDQNVASGQQASHCPPSISAQNHWVMFLNSQNGSCVRTSDGAGGHGGGAWDGERWIQSGHEV